MYEELERVLNLMFIENDVMYLSSVTLFIIVELFAAAIIIACIEDAKSISLMQAIGLIIFLPGVFIVSLIYLAIFITVKICRFVVIIFKWLHSIEVIAWEDKTETNE